MMLVMIIMMVVMGERRTLPSRRLACHHRAVSSEIKSDEDDGDEADGL
jgi:hypothetical protein